MAADLKAANLTLSKRTVLCFSSSEDLTVVYLEKYISWFQFIILIIIYNCIIMYLYASTLSMKLINQLIKLTMIIKLIGRH